MSRDDITRMARESHIDVYGLGKDYAKFADALEHFAALVAAAERERLAAKFMEMHNAQQHRNNYFAFAARVIREEA